MQGNKYQEGGNERAAYSEKVYGFRRHRIRRQLLKKSPSAPKEECEDRGNNPVSLFQHLLYSSIIAISAPVVLFLLYPVNEAKNDGYGRRGNEEIEKKFYQRFTPVTSSIFAKTASNLERDDTEQSIGEKIFRVKARIGKHRRS
jgi:hypothetical protein